MHGREAKYIHFWGENCVKMDLELYTGLICNVEFMLCVFVINYIINYDLTFCGASFSDELMWFGTGTSVGLL
jgi:hypothetical protein